jgi:hypothetical protein
MDKRTSIMRVRLAFALAVSILAFSQMGFGQSTLQLKPNLRAFPASDLSVATTASGGREIRFTTTTWNAGDGPLELIAGETGPAGQNVYQRVYLDNGSHYDNLAGTFELHPAHDHFHLEGYALYTLQPLNAPGASQRTGQKTTFCLMDTTKVNLRLPGSPNRAVYGGCGSTFQGLSVGWGDRYGSHLEGQSIDITGNPDGTYRLMIEADPESRLLETDESDNASCVLLNVNGFSVTVLGSCAASAGELTVTGISPATGPAGSVINATITGTGFYNGAKVSFENGSGSRPTASNVVVVNANTITAAITVKSGSAGRDRVWDLRVDSAVLADAFTVVP